jgi:uncharacterized protein (DUF2147 family)
MGSHALSRTVAQAVCAQAICALAFVVVSPQAGWAADDSGGEIVGRWVTEGAESIIEIYKEVDSDADAKEKSRYYGKLTWIHDAAYTDRGMKITDTMENWNNSDEARRKDPLLGRLILEGLVYNSRKKRWEKGRAYDPESGKKYKCIIWVTQGDDGLDRLKLRGYIGVSLIGHTVEWTRTKD